MILIPKRKMTVETPAGEVIETIIEHTTEKVYDELSTGYSSVTNIANFDYLCKIPVGTDKYPNPP